MFLQSVGRWTIMWLLPSSAFSGASGLWRSQRASLLLCISFFSSHTFPSPYFCLRMCPWFDSAVKPSWVSSPSFQLFCSPGILCKLGICPSRWKLQVPQFSEEWDGKHQSLFSVQKKLHRCQWRDNPEEGRVCVCFAELFLWTLCLIQKTHANILYLHNAFFFNSICPVELP